MVRIRTAYRRPLLYHKTMDAGRSFSKESLSSRRLTSSESDH